MFQSNVNAVQLSSTSIASSSSTDDAGTSSTSSISAGTSSGGALRDPDEIPSRWCPEVEDCIMEHSLSDSARCEIVRALVNQLFARTRKPARVDCEHHARKLILKYPFMKDDMGNGYVSMKSYYK